MFRMHSQPKARFFTIHRNLTYRSMETDQTFYEEKQYKGNKTSKRYKNICWHSRLWKKNRKNEQERKYEETCTLYYRR